MDLETKRRRNRKYQQDLRERRGQQLRDLEASLRTASVALQDLSDVLLQHKIVHAVPELARPLQAAIKAVVEAGPDNTTETTNVATYEVHSTAPSSSRNAENDDPNNSTNHAVNHITKQHRPKGLALSCAPTDIFSQQNSTLASFVYELGVPSWYAHLENSFARTLQRACIYRGLNLLSQQYSTSPFTFQAFRLASHFFSLTEIRMSLARKVSKPRGSNMDTLDVAPFLNVGGSGTHFPRLDMPGQPLLDSESWSINAIRQPVRKDIDYHNIEIDSILAQSDCVGEWYDSNDVEQYLRAVGLDLNDNPSTASFVHGGKTQLIDMGDFVGHLAQRSTCLVRSCGFRRSDIDQALRVSASHLTVR